MISSPREEIPAKEGTEAREGIQEMVLASVPEESLTRKCDYPKKSRY